jgi:hypothetical protein
MLGTYHFKSVYCNVWHFLYIPIIITWSGSQFAKQNGLIKFYLLLSDIYIYMGCGTSTVRRASSATPRTRSARHQIQFQRDSRRHVRRKARHDIMENMSFDVEETVATGIGEEEEQGRNTLMTLTTNSTLDGVDGRESVPSAPCASCDSDCTKMKTSFMRERMLSNPLVLCDHSLCCGLAEERFHRTNEDVDVRRREKIQKNVHVKSIVVIPAQTKGVCLEWSLNHSHVLRDCEFFIEGFDQGQNRIIFTRGCPMHVCCYDYFGVSFEEGIELHLTERLLAENTCYCVAHPLSLKKSRCHRSLKKSVFGSSSIFICIWTCYFGRIVQSKWFDFPVTAIPKPNDECRLHVSCLPPITPKSLRFAPEKRRPRVDFSKMKTDPPRRHGGGALLER